MVKKFKAVEEETFLKEEPLEKHRTLSKSSDSEQPVFINKELIKQLEGVSKLFDEKHTKDLLVLQDLGVAVDFGACGWARGYSWRNFSKK